MVSAWNLVCGRFINFKKVRKKLTLLTFGCPSDIGLWHCLIHTLELAVGNALELPLTQLTYGHFLKVYIHHIASHRRSCENLVTVPTICISVSQQSESCLVSLGDFIFQSCVRSSLGIVFPSETNIFTTLQMKLGKVQKKPDFKDYFPNCVQPVLSKILR